MSEKPAELDKLARRPAKLLRMLNEGKKLDPNVLEREMPHAHGIELLIRRFKTDQEGEGRPVFDPIAKSDERCPGKALQSWLEQAGVGSGPIFRRIDRHDNMVDTTALTPKSVALILKSAVAHSNGIKAAGLVSGHSLRAGFVTEAAKIGMQTSVIMSQTGHKSLEMVMRYIRPAHKRQIQRQRLL